MSIASSRHDAEFFVHAIHVQLRTKLFHKQGDFIFLCRLCCSSRIRLLSHVGTSLGARASSLRASGVRATCVYLNVPGEQLSLLLVSLGIFDSEALGFSSSHLACPIDG